MEAHTLFTIIEGVGLTLAVIDFLGLTQKIEVYLIRLKSTMDSLNFGLDYLYEKIDYVAVTVGPLYFRPLLYAFGFSMAVSMSVIIVGDAIYPGEIPRIFEHDIAMYLIMIATLPVTVVLAPLLLAIAFCQPFLLFAAVFNTVKLICLLFHYLSLPRAGIVGSIGLVLAILSFVGQVYL